MKRFGVGILWVIGIYFVARAVVEPFVIDVNNPATYRDDWGGPHLAGVLLVHCGLGLIAASLMAWRLMRRSSRRLRTPAKSSSAEEAERTPGDRAARCARSEPTDPALSASGHIHPDVRTPGRV